MVSNGRRTLETTSARHARPASRFLGTELFSSNALALKAKSRRDFMSEASAPQCVDLDLRAPSKSAPNGVT